MKTGIIEPYYIEGKGIYIPIIDAVLGMKDEPNGPCEYILCDGAPSFRDWLIIYYFKDEINKLLRENGGEEFNEGYYWACETEEYRGMTYRSVIDMSDGHGDGIVEGGEACNRYLYRL